MRVVRSSWGRGRVGYAVMALSMSVACSSGSHDGQASGGAAGEVDVSEHGGATAVAGGGGRSANGGAFSQAGSSGSNPAANAGTGGIATSAAGNVGTGGNAGATIAGDGPAKPERIATVKLVSDIVVKEGYVYFGDFDDEPSPATGHGHLSKVRAAGGAATVIARQEVTDQLGIYPSALAVDGTHVYWADSGLTARVLKTPIAGGATVELWKDADCTLWGSLALEGDNLYTLERCAQTGANLIRVPTGGSDAKTVGSGTGGAWTPGALGANSNWRGLAVGGGLAYWSNPGGSVVSFPLAGGDQATLVASAFDVSGPSSVVLSGDHLFFVQNDFMLQKRGAVLSVALGTPGATRIADKQNIEEDTALALDETSVYWAVDDAIMSVPRAGGTAVTVASSLGNPRALAVDGSCVYWTEKTGGVWRVRKQPH